MEKNIGNIYLLLLSDMENLKIICWNDGFRLAYDVPLFFYHEQTT